jgi:hypothetical protein
MDSKTESKPRLNEFAEFTEFDDLKGPIPGESLYVPPFPVIQEALKLEKHDLDGAGNILIPVVFFKHLMAIAISEAFFDERWYLETYPDIAAAVQRGDEPSALTHYIVTGYYEGRSPGPCFVNRQWYEQFYPDVAAGLREGIIADSAEHFHHNGYFEGRVAQIEHLPILAKWMRALGRSEQ